MTATPPPTRWQFSLRTLFICVLACAILLGTWRALGVEMLLTVSFVMLSGMPAVLLDGPLSRVYLVSFSAIYGPFVVMATYTFLYVSCSHCKETTWAVLPYAPGMIPVELIRDWLDLPRWSHTVGRVVVFFVSVMMVGGLTWLVRARGRWVQILSVAGALIWCSFSAFILLQLIRA